MEENETPNLTNIYVDLDSIFDLRLAMLYYLDPDLTTELTANGKYYSRITDEFDYITSDIFKAVYENRNKSLLNLAVPTNVLNLITEYILEFNLDKVSIDNYEETIVYVNIDKFDLNLDEIALIEEYMLKGMKGTKVKVVSMKPIEITPEWVNENISVMFMYYGIEWLELHTATLDLIKCPLMDKSLITPALTTTAVDGLNKNKDIDEFFKNVEGLAEKLISISMLPVNDFCRIE